jgi:hypothetical protein
MILSKNFRCRVFFSLALIDGRLGQPGSLFECSSSLHLPDVCLVLSLSCGVRTTSRHYTCPTLAEKRGSTPYLSSVTLVLLLGHLYQRWATAPMLSTRTYSGVESRSLPPVLQEVFRCYTSDSHLSDLNNCFSFFPCKKRIHNSQVWTIKSVI